MVAVSSAILDFTLSHGLGQAGFRKWLALVDTEARAQGKATPAFFRALPRRSILAWCESQRARQLLKDMSLEQGLPAGAGGKNWSFWESIWTGGSYVLQDFDTGDLKGLAKLFLDGACRTYPAIAAKIAKLG